jgi:hypothetical protein
VLSSSLFPESPPGNCPCEFAVRDCDLAIDDYEAHALRKRLRLLVGGAVSYRLWIEDNHVGEIAFTD